MNYRLVAAFVWAGIAIFMRLYASEGGDASIVGGLLFLVWTAPFGMIWQFYIYDYAIRWMPTVTAQWIGDGVVILSGLAFWFVFIPLVRKRRWGTGTPTGRGKEKI